MINSFLKCPPFEWGVSKPQTSKTQTSDLENTDLENSDPSKTQTSKTQTPRKQTPLKIEMYYFFHLAILVDNRKTRWINLTVL